MPAVLGEDGQIVGAKSVNMISPLFCGLLVGGVKLDSCVFIHHAALGGGREICRCQDLLIKQGEYPGIALAAQVFQ